MAVEDELGGALEGLVGLECCSTIWGKGTGSVISIGFGPMRRLAQPISNPWLSERDRNFEADFRLLVWCAWRIRRNQKVLVAWRDAALDSEMVFRRSSEVIGKEVLRVVFDKISGDARFELTDGYQIDLFCDVTNEEEGDENYIVYLPHANFTVGLDGEVIKESKETRQ